MSDRQRHFLASALATALLLLLLLLASLDDLFTPSPPALIALREVQMYVPPPPPPPPTQQQDSQSSASPQLMLSVQKSDVALELMDIDVDLPQGDFNSFGKGVAGPGEGLGLDWDTVQLSDLDGFPMVLTSPVLSYPNEAIKDNVDKFVVKFHILIDEEGRTYPIRIVENPYPALNEKLEKYASAVRFSPPMRLGVPVRTEYLWPVIFQRKEQ